MQSKPNNMNKFENALQLAESKKKAKDEIALAVQNKKGEMLWAFSQPFLEFITYLQYESDYRFNHFNGSTNHTTPLLGLYFTKAKETWLGEVQRSMISTTNRYILDIGVLGINVAFMLEDSVPLVVAHNNLSSKTEIGRFLLPESFIEWLSDMVILRKK